MYTRRMGSWQPSLHRLQWLNNPRSRRGRKKLRVASTQRNLYRKRASSSSRVVGRITSSFCRYLNLNHRAGPLLSLRTQQQPLAMSDVRKSLLWSTAIRRARRERTRPSTLRNHSASYLCKTRYYPTRRISGHLLLCMQRCASRCVPEGPSIPFRNQR